MRAIKPTLLVLCLALGASAQTYRIHDGGMARTFIVEEIPAAPAALKDAPAEEPQIVLYEAGAKKTEYSKRIATKQVLVELKAGTDPAALAQQYGIVLVSSPSYAPGFHIFETSTAFGSLTLAETLRNDSNVISAEPMLARKHQKKSIPNDPQFTNQWHLLNTGGNGGTAGIDINVTNVWETYQGSNIVIGIIDDGLLETHEDLSNNVNTALSYDYWGNDDDPAPESGDDHGTAVAGIAAARGNNGIGVSGAAPCAELAGLRINLDATVDSQEGAALSHSNALIHIKNNSWGPSDDGETLEGPGTLAASAIKSGAKTGRGGKGTLFFWAGGNGWTNINDHEDFIGDNANYDGYANSIYTIAIGAVSDKGSATDYGEPGACLVVSAPSSSDGRQGITTTSANGNYESDFGGTSAATPLAAGVGALMLEANPNLGWRDVQEVLMKSARKLDASDSDWTTNSAGFHFNHKYGAGMVDADAAVSLSETWGTLGAHTNLSQSLTNLSQSIPDDDPAGVTNTFFVNKNFRVEHVTLSTEITHTYRSDIEIWLTSPGGTESLLAWRNDDSAENLNWTFSTVRNWGENSFGDWIVKVLDNWADDTGTVNSLTLTLYGSDGDDIDDAWEIAHFGDTITVNNSSDYDADSFIDYDEWRAGTQPTNAASKLSIDTVPAGSDGQIGWQSISGKSYTIEYSTNLLKSFQPLETNVTATPPQNIFTNLPSGNPAFYRILLETDAGVP